MLSRVAVELLAGFLSLTLVTTGLAKLLAFRRTADQVGRGIVPEPLAAPLVAGLVVVELGLGAAVGAGVAPAVSAGAAVLLFAAFAAYRVLLLRHDPAADCGCGGAEPVGRAAGRPELALAHAHAAHEGHEHDHEHDHEHGGHEHGGPADHDHDAPDRIDIGALVVHGPTRERVLSQRLASLGLLVLAGGYAALTWSGTANGPLPGLLVLATVVGALALRAARTART